MKGTFLKLKPHELQLCSLQTSFKIYIFKYTYFKRKKFANKCIFFFNFSINCVQHIKKQTSLLVPDFKQTNKQTVKRIHQWENKSHSC